MIVSVRKSVTALSKRPDPACVRLVGAVGARAQSFDLSPAQIAQLRAAGYVVELGAPNAREIVRLVPSISRGLVKLRGPGGSTPPTAA